MKAIAGSPLKLYNANTTTLLQSLRDGAPGYSGSWRISSAALCVTRHQTTQRRNGAEPAHLRFQIERQYYPVNAKYHLQAIEKLPLDTFARTRDDRGLTETFREEVQQMDLLVRSRQPGCACKSGTAGMTDAFTRERLTTPHLYEQVADLMERRSSPGAWGRRRRAGAGQALPCQPRQHPGTELLRERGVDPARQRQPHHKAGGGHLSAMISRIIRMDDIGYNDIYGVRIIMESAPAWPPCAPARRIWPPCAGS